MQHNPHARVIVILRNPVEAAHALHSARWNDGHDDIENFEMAWHAQPARLAGERLPPNWPDRATLQYGPIYRYAAQVRRVIEHVPEAQRHFMVYEEFFADPGPHYARLLEFLGLPRKAQESFPRVKQSVKPRSRALERWMRNPPPWLRALYFPLRPLFRAAHLQPARAVSNLNFIPARNAPLRADFRAELERYFSADIAELERLLGRSLWRGAAPLPDRP